MTLIGPTTGELKRVLRRAGDAQATFAVLPAGCRKVTGYRWKP